ncbi:MAG: GNAT family N-acetyltransferase [Oscillospiraceae bacterium]|jgi:ribosomal-protein-alanine N-acetyltransferase|nr:GNAT family N-acetyltransferase [Oscillospiraceae bacterium]
MNAEIDITNIRLRTKRLTLRPWEPGDVGDLFEYASADGVGQMAGWAPHKDLATSQEILDMFIREKHVFALEYRGKVIGSLGIEKYNEKELPDFDAKRGAELGFVIAKDHWGQGLAAEAVREVERYLFEELHLDFITCGHFAWNAQSGRVQEKCGFRFLKRYEYETLMGTREMLVLNVLTKEEWQSC